MNTRVLKVKTDAKQTPFGSKEYEGFQPYRWLLDPTGLDDLDIKVLNDFIKFTYDDPALIRYGEMVCKAALELARRLGHKLVFDDEFTEKDDPIVEQLVEALYMRDTLGWLDFRRGEPSYKTTDV